MIVLIGGDKYCPKCFTVKHLSEFSLDKSTKTGRCYWCKKCASANSRLNHNRRIIKNDVAYMRAKRDAYVKNKYNISLDHYEQKLKDQDCKCSICKIDLLLQGPLTHLDHNHQTGKIRDFLCTNCNRGLGHFKDNQELLMKAANYLDRHTEDGTQKEGRRL